MDCFVASAPLRKRFAFVAGNDGWGCSCRPENQKSRPRACCFTNECFASAGCPGGAEAPPGQKRYFLAFFFFVAFLAFLAFFAFLAIASSLGLMGGNATRGLLGEGLASQQPQSSSEQIRARLPRAVTPVSLCYPQLLCIFGHLSAAPCIPRRPVTVNSAPMRAAQLRRSGTG